MTADEYSTEIDLLIAASSLSHPDEADEDTIPSRRLAEIHRTIAAAAVADGVRDSFAGAVSVGTVSATGETAETEAPRSAALTIETVAPAKSEHEQTSLDVDLARRFSSGDEAAFAAVFEAFRGLVFGIALHALGDPGLAEEASEKAFLRLWRTRARYDPERSLEAWLFDITRRTAIDIYRRERRLPVTAAAEERDIGVEALSVERLWEAWEVRRAVDALPPDEAEAARLAHFYQLSHSEIAEHLGVPISTVKSRLYRAHKRLAKELNQTAAVKTDVAQGHDLIESAGC